MTQPEPLITPERVAWTVEIKDMTCVVFASTKAKAQWIATRAYWDAGYGSNEGWPRAKAFRAPCYDKSYYRNEPARAYSEDYVRDSI